MKNPSNPFVLGKYIGGKYFCDRKEETATLIRHLENGRSVTLVSQRRMGKSGLIQHLFDEEVIKKTYDTIFIDIYATGSLQEFAYLLASAVYRSVKGSLMSRVERFFKEVASLRIGSRLDAITGEPTFDLQPGLIKDPRTTLNEMFDYLERAQRPVVIAIDEFQQINEYPQRNTEALLRTLMQRSTNIQFIFAGSKRHVLNGMFQSPSKPFYNSTVFMELGPIAPNEYTAFCIQHFAAGGKILQESAVMDVYEANRGITWYNQALLNELYSITPEGGECTIEQVSTARAVIVDRNAPFYLDTLSRLSERQKQVLLAIAHAGTVEEITSTDFTTTYALGSASTVQSAVRVLAHRDIVCKNTDGLWCVSDVLFGQWLKSY